MDQEMTVNTDDNSVETEDVKGEVRKNRGLSWAIISFALISLTIIIGVIIGIALMPNPEKMNQPSNTSTAPVQR